MQLHTQSVDTASVRYETLDGREHLVAPTVAVKPSDDLDGGYVPADELRASLDDWNGRPIPVYHPVNSRGQLISANDPEVRRTSSIGEFYNAEYDAQNHTIRGELWIDTEKATEIGGAATEALSLLANGERLEVSTGYRSADGSPGEYDGEYRSAVQVDIRPDHVAVLPGTKGRCTWADGCGAPRVNAANFEEGTAEQVARVIDGIDETDRTEGLTLATNSSQSESHTDEMALRANVRSTARTPSYSGTSETEWSRPSLDDFVSGMDLGDISSVEDLSGEQASRIADRTLLGEAAAETYDELVFFPVVDPSSDSLNANALRAVLGGRGSQAEIPAAARDSAQSTAGRLLEDEFDDEAEVNANAPSASNSSANSESEPEPEPESDLDLGTFRSGLSRLASSVGLTVQANTADELSGETSDSNESESERVETELENTTDNETTMTSASGGCTCDGNTDSSTDPLRTNQQEGDRVRWDSEAGLDREPDDVRYGIVVDALEDGGDTEVLVAVYAPNSDGTEWEATDSTETLDTDSLSVIDSFPAISQVAGNSNQTTTMTTDTDYSVNTLVANSVFDADELRANDDLRRKVAETISLNANGESNNIDDGDEDADEDTDDDEEDTDDDEEGEDETEEAIETTEETGLANESLLAAVNDLQATVENQQETITELKANANAEHEQRRDQLISGIMANSSSYDEDELRAASDALLASTHETVTSGVADFSARGMASPDQTQRANSEDDSENYTAGTMRDYKQRQSQARTDGGER